MLEKCIGLDHPLTNQTLAKIMIIEQQKNVPLKDRACT
jgi:hypothetical protein